MQYEQTHFTANLTNASLIYNKYLQHIPLCSIYILSAHSDDVKFEESTIFNFGQCKAVFFPLANFRLKFATYIRKHSSTNTDTASSLTVVERKTSRKAYQCIDYSTGDGQPGR